MYVLSCIEVKSICETDYASSIPPYVKLGFIQASGNLVQIQESNPIELDWYWWMTIGSVGTLVIVITGAVISRRKQRTVKQREKI